MICKSGYGQYDSQRVEIWGPCSKGRGDLGMIQRTVIAAIKKSEEQK